MAQLLAVNLQPHKAVVDRDKVNWEACGRQIRGLPQLTWKSGLPWREANLWLYERACEKQVGLKTLSSYAASLHSYAKWLESTQTHWWDFPQRKADRCLVRYRGALVEAREAGVVAPSTATARMRDVIAFYRWLKGAGLLSPEWPMWDDRTVGIRLTDATGLERTLSVATTDLAIPNRKRDGTHLEGGVTPLSLADRDALLKLAKEHASQEVFLMLALGFFTGMRLGTICDLKCDTLLNVAPDSSSPQVFRLAVGPNASPPVATKHGVTGQIIIPLAFLQKLREYATSVRRLSREALAHSDHKDLIFLTRFGNPYATRGVDKSPSLNSEIYRLKKVACENAINLRDFNFHQTRATFGTTVAEIAIRIGGAINAIALVKDLLLHKHEATTLQYIKFVQRQPIKEALANEFSRDFMGSLSQRLEPEP